MAPFRELSLPKKIGLWLAAVLYMGAGILHFLKTDSYLRIMPPYIPWHLWMVRISGVFEVLGGLGLLYARTRRAAAWGLVALLIAVFPANVYMATNPVEAGAASIAPWIRWARLPLQVLLAAWLLWCTYTARTRHLRGNVQQSGGNRIRMFKYLGLVALLGVSVLSAKTYKFTVLDPAQAGNVQLKPGDYRAEVEGSQVTLKDSRGHQIDTAVKVEKMDHKAHETVMKSSNADGQRHLNSIEFAGSTEKLVFEPAVIGTR